MRSDPWSWHVPADLVECDSEGHVLPDWPLRDGEQQAPLLACSTLATCDHPHAGGGLMLLFSPWQQTSPIKPIPRSLAVEDTAPGTPAKSQHQD